MIVVGLTGSIGMGKTTAARMLRRMGLAVHDSDATVHRLYGPGGGAVSAVAAVFPEAVRDRAVDRARLAASVVGAPEKMQRLESIVHPLVQAEIEKFLRRARGRRMRLAVLDVPLLFESGRYKLCDAVVVVSAPRFIQEQRVLARAGMTRERWTALLDRQLPDSVKRRRADFIVPTGLCKRLTWRRLQAVIARLTLPGRKARHARNRTRH